MYQTSGEMRQMRQEGINCRVKIGVITVVK